MSVIPRELIDSLTHGPSASKTTQVANMQNYIQELLGSTHHTFLQGSYKNDTAISDINDVDIVAVRLRTYSGTYSPIHATNTVFWDQIFSEIETKLRNQSRYTWNVTRGDKCVCVRGAFNADVVPAVQVGEDHLIDPIVIYSFQDQREKLNLPITHYKNGVEKHQATDENYKPTVRMFKNWARNHFGEDNSVVSSYNVESLVHGVADSDFYDDRAATFILAGRSILVKLAASNSIPSVCGGENICANWNQGDRNQFHIQLTESVEHALRAYRATTMREAEQNWRAAFNL